LKKPFLRVLFFVFILSGLFPQCSSDSDTDSGFEIVNEAVNNRDSPFYLDLGIYPKQRDTLPIGVFDSGTGGLTVLNSFLELDNFKNDSHSPGSDGIPDFLAERFIYLADEANMPYGRYDAEGKADFLRELVIKDALFLMNNRYYSSPKDSNPVTGKERVKAIVVACNTATAYGLEKLKEIMDEIGLDIPVLGIIDAGSRDALKLLQRSGNVNTTIGVLATEGTCSAEGYPNSIRKNKDEILGVNDIKIIQQAGIGLAGAIDGDENYIKPSASGVREPEYYKGPGMNNPDYPLDTAFWKEYNFLTDSDLLIEKNDNGAMVTVQLNSVRSYINYAITHLVLQALDEETGSKISTVILGCTHYPFFSQNFTEHFSYLRSLGKPYSDILADSIILVDPARSLAEELYVYLDNEDLWGEGDMSESEFYISTPNPLISKNRINDQGEFPYSYKYGREINTGAQFVKIVPFSDRWIKPVIKDRIRENIPVTYNIIYNRK